MFFFSLGCPQEGFELPEVMCQAVNEAPELVRSGRGG